MKKKIALLLLLLLSGTVSFTQTLYRTYYDYEKQHVQEEYYANSYGVKNGLYKKFSEYGGVLEQGTYKNNIEVGYWIYKDDEGKLLLEETFDDEGFLNGLKVTYKNGYKYKEENYKHSRQDSRSELNGWSKEYWLDDPEAYNSKLILNKEGRPILHYLRYYKNDLQDSISKIYNLDGNLSGEEHFRNGKYNGKATYYAKDAPSFVMEEGYYRNDTIIGKWKITYDKGGKQTITKSEADEYEILDAGDGRSNIIKLAYYDMTGIKKMEGNYNTQTGLWCCGVCTRYYSNGNMRSRGKYDDRGMCDSIWDSYSIYGKDSVKQKYVSGNVESILPVDNK